MSSDLDLQNKIDDYQEEVYERLLLDAATLVAKGMERPASMRAAVKQYNAEQEAVSDITGVLEAELDNPVPIKKTPQLLAIAKSLREQFSDFDDCLNS